MFLALALSFAVHGGADLALEGPPAICQPFDIGKTKSLPWKDGAFAADPDYDLVNLNQDLAELLDQHDDAMVRMESIRRAVIYVTGFGFEREKMTVLERRYAASSLISMLQARALAPHMEAKLSAEKHTAPRLFDLGFALGALHQMDWKGELCLGVGNGAQQLNRAGEWEKASAAMHLGMALALWGPEVKYQSSDAHFLKAAKLAGPNAGLLTKNIMNCAKRFHNVDTYDELVTKLSKQLASS